MAHSDLTHDLRELALRRTDPRSLVIGPRVGGDLVEQEAKDGSTPDECLRFYYRNHVFHGAHGGCDAGYIAHYDFGLTRQEIRTPALVGAIIIAVVIATLVAVDFFSKRLRRPRSIQALRCWQTIVTGVGLRSRQGELPFAIVADAPQHALKSNIAQPSG